MAAELDETVEPMEAFGTRPVDWVRTRAWPLTRWS